MSSIKVKFRPSTIADQEGSIFYQIIHSRKVRALFPGYRIFQSEWNEKRAAITTAHRSERNPILISIRDHIRCDVERLAKIDRRLKSTGVEYAVEDIVEEFNRYTRECSIFNYTESLIAKMKQNGKIRTAETYKSTLNCFKKFRNNRDIMLDNITGDLMVSFESSLRLRGVAPNTIAFYTRILRAIYNRAVEEEIIEDRHPFRHVLTRIDKTVKRALPIDTIKKIYRLDLSQDPSLDHARDIFMLSFFLRGMSFIDMAFLKKSDLKNGHIYYRRRKTSQQLIIKWTNEMQAILNKYPENKSQYLLPIIRNTGINERRAYRNIGYNINRRLKKIAEILHIPIPLTLYVARHSWASTAKSKGIPLSVISEGMGHDSETTTQIYLASLDTTVVDQANALILNSLN